MTHAILRQLTLVDVLKNYAQSRKDHCALIFSNGEKEYRRLTYQELDKAVQSRAAAISEIAQPGDRAFLLYESLDEFLISFLACLYSRVIAVPAFPPSESRDLKRLLAILQDADSKILLTESKLMGQINAAQIFKGAESLCTDQAKPMKYDGPLPSSDDICFLQYTSGSTSTPRGVILNHRNLLSNLSMISAGFQADTSTIWVSWLPLFHDMGLIGGALCPLFCGGTSVILSPLDFLQKPLRWLQTISHYQATITGAPNFAFDLLIKRCKEEEYQSLKLHTLQIVFNGAEPVRAETMQRFAQKFSGIGLNPLALRPVYGLAEATLIASCTAMGTGAHHEMLSSKKLENENKVATAETPQDLKLVVSCGIICPGETWAIVNPKTEKTVKDGSVGEIWLSGDHVAQGYWNKERESIETFKAELKEYPGKTFLRTGDLGFLKQGQLYICGRIKDLIILNGRNYYPQDLEFAIEECHPLIRKGCLAAFSFDTQQDTKIAIVAETKEITAVQSEEILQAIRQAIHKSFGLPLNQIALIKEKTIPKTSSGKIQRSLTRKLLLEQKLECYQNWQEEKKVDGDANRNNAFKKQISDLIEGQKILLSRAQILFDKFDNDEDVINNVKAVTMTQEHKTSTVIPVTQTHFKNLSKTTSKKADLDNGTIEAQLIALFARVIEQPADGILPDEPLQDYGIDSVAAYEFYSEITDSFDVQLPRRILFDHPTISSIAKVIHSIKTGKTTSNEIG